MEGTEETIVNQEDPQTDPAPASTEFAETPSSTPEEETLTDFKKKEEEEEKPAEDGEKDSEEAPAADKDEEDEDKKKKYELLAQEYEVLQQQYTELQEKYDGLVTQCNELTQFKLDVENVRKDELINSFYMLSDEDKADVIAHKAEYSLDEIESKLSVICVRKKVNFTVSNETEEDKPITTFSLGENEVSVPAWVKACENTQKNKK